MRIVRTIAQMRDVGREIRRVAGPRGLGLVPTMGAIHEGHLSLVRAARASCGAVAATIFVNPLQFGPAEDFSRYPRTFEQDCELLDDAGVELLFAPATAEMVPPGAQTVVDVPGIGDRLDGASRPGHFRGVATIVTKLLHIVQPDRAFFGQKDAAQVAVLRAMIRDLNFAVEMVVCPTVREPDGLALSSRNRYLSDAERVRALALPAALREVEQRIAAGERSAGALRASLEDALRRADGVRLDYAEIVDAETLEPVSEVRLGTLVAVAAWVGATRLIDNVVLTPRLLAGEMCEQDSLRTLEAVR